jgi:tetratricopeptide (TPR) repeat protein
MQSFTKSLSINPNHGTRILLANAANKYLMENGYANDDKYVIASSALEHVDFVIENSSVLYPRAYYLRCILGRVLDFPDDSNIKFCQEALRANRSLKVTDEIAGYLVAEDAVLNTIGLIFKDNRYYSEAINAFNEGLAINPMSSDILVNLASLFTAQEQYDLATEYYDRAEHFITDPSVRSLLMTNKGYSLERQGFHLAAKAIYQEAIEITSIPHPQLVRNFENIELFCAQNICN